MNTDTCLCQNCLETMLESERCIMCRKNNMSYCEKCHLKLEPEYE